MGGFTWKGFLNPFDEMHKPGSDVHKRLAPYVAAAAATYYSGGNIGAGKAAMGAAESALGSGDAEAQAGGFYGDPSASTGVTPQSVDVVGKGSSFLDTLGKYSGAIGSVANAGLGYLGQSQTNAQNVAEAQKNRDFQASQTGTSYQRGVADMQAAGLNPMLAYSQGGASSGGGAQAQIGNAIGAGTSGALQAAQTIAGIRNTEAQTIKTTADTDLTRSNTDLNDVTADQLRQQTLVGAASARQIEAQISNLKAQLPGLHSESERAAIETRIRALEEAGAKTQGSFMESKFGQASPYLKLIMDLFRGGSSAYGSIKR